MLRTLEGLERLGKLKVVSNSKCCRSDDPARWPGPHLLPDLFCGLWPVACGVA